MMHDLKKRFLGEFEKGTSIVAIGRTLGKDASTLWRWRQADPVFRRAVEELKEFVDELRVQMVEDAVFERIIRGEASAAEAIFWLKNRAPERWRDRVNVAQEGKVSIDALRKIFGYNEG